MNACAIASRIRTHRSRLRAITVRRVLVCPVVAFAEAMGPARLAGQDRGCYLKHGALGNLPDLRSSSGNPQLDRALIAEIAMRVVGGRGRVDREPGGSHA